MNLAATNQFRVVLHRVFCAPVLGPWLASRFLSGGVIVVCLIQTLSVFFGAELWPCPMLRATGVPCPGCGLTRAAHAALRGDFTSMAHLYLFAPAFMLAAMLCGVAVALPDKMQVAFSERVSRLESRFPITTLCLSFTIVYWLVRLMTGQHPDLH